MKTSLVTAATCGAASALVIVGLALAQLGEAGERPAGAEEKPLVVQPATLLAEDSPPRLEIAKERKAAPESVVPRFLVDEKIEAALLAHTTLEFTDTPLQDVIDAVAEMHQINILIDHRALDDVGMATDVPVTFHLSDVSLHSGLSLLLRPLDLTWAIRDEVLLITTPEEAEQMLIPVVYDVGDLVKCRDKLGDEWADYDTLIEVITSTVEPDTWDEVGGPGAIEAAPFAGAEMLAVSQTYQIHGKIEKLLKNFRSITDARGGDEPPMCEKPEWPAGMSGLGGMGGMSGMSGGMGGGFVQPGGAPLSAPPARRRTAPPRPIQTGGLKSTTWGK